MVGLGPAIHEKPEYSGFAFVDARPKPGHDATLKEWRHEFQ
jgi:hypothetical protein